MKQVAASMLAVAMIACFSTSSSAESAAEPAGCPQASKTATVRIAQTVSPDCGECTLEGGGQGIYSNEGKCVPCAAQ